MTDQVQSGEANIWNPRMVLELSSDTKRVEESQNAIEGQTLFTLETFTYTTNTGSLAVYLNGLLLRKGIDWNEQSETTFFLATPAASGDYITAVGYVAIEGTVDGGGTQNALPLSGGTMNSNALIAWSAPTGVINGEAAIGLEPDGSDSVFIIRPNSDGTDNIRHKLELNATTYIESLADGTWVIEGRPNYASLPDNAIATKADVATGGGLYVSLGGSEMLAGATMTYATTGISKGQSKFGTFLATPTFQWSPAPGLEDVGYLFATDAALTKALAATTDGEWAITGRPDYETISGTAIAIKDDVETRASLSGSTFVEGAINTYPKGASATESSDANAGFINFFGITTYRVQAAQANTNLGIGYLFLTDAQGVSAPFIVGSKYDGFRVDGQVYTDQRAIITKQYLEDNTLGLPPTNPPEVEWVAKTDAAGENATWVQNTGGGTGEINTAATLGTGSALTLPKTGDVLNFASISAGPNVTITATEGGNNFEIAASSGGGATWGGIIGTLSDQIDLQTALNAKISDTGDTWAADAKQQFPTPVALPAFSGGEFVFTGVVGMPTFLYSPRDIGGDERVGYLFNTGVASGSSLGGSAPTGWEITNQVNNSDNSIITRGLGNSLYQPVGSYLTSVSWGDIQGTLSAQTDLQSALEDKAPVSTTVTTNGVQTITGAKTFSSTLNAQSIVTDALQTTVGSVDSALQVTIGAATPTAASHATRKDYVDGVVAGLQPAGSYVTTNSTQNISGQKTFQSAQTYFQGITCNAVVTTTGSLQSALQVNIGSATPTADSHATRKDYVDNAVAGLQPAGNYVTTDTSQSISGQKTFTAFNQFNGNVTFGGSVNFFNNGGNFNNARLVNVGTAISAGDAVNKSYLESNALTLSGTQTVTGAKTFGTGTTVTTIAGGGCEVSGSTLGVALNATGGAVYAVGLSAGNSKLIGLANPDVANDGANKGYVDATVSDANAKTIVSSAPDTSWIMEVPVYSYMYDRTVSEFTASPDFRDGLHLSPMAQDVQVLNSHAVYESSVKTHEGDPLLALDDRQSLYALVAEVQKLRARVEELELLTS